MSRRMTSRVDESHGQAMVELVIVLPLLCTLLFGIVQFGIVWNNYVTLTDAVRAGARKAAVSRRSNPVNSGCAQVRASAPSLEDRGLLCDGSVSGSLDHPGASVTIRGRHPYTVKVLGFVFASGFLETTTEERVE